MSNESLESYKAHLIEHAMQAGALKFGHFILKSGRVSPYFFNAGLLSTGPLLEIVSKAYARTITDAQVSGAIPEFDVLFGPAYKGIPFAACTALMLNQEYSKPVGFAYDRKEAKDHGEGGQLVGASVTGRRVVVLDDVMTSGLAVRGVIAKVKAEGGVVVGVVQLLDREEAGFHGTKSTAAEVAELIGEGSGSVRCILRMRDLMKWLEVNERQEELTAMKGYWKEHGTK